jgi:hypothetical protein
MAIVVVVVELFLTVFLGLVVEEVEQAKGLELELSDQDLQVSADWPRGSPPSLKDLNCTRRLNARTSPSLPLGQYLTFFIFYLP